MSEHLDERLRTAARTYRRLGNQSAESMFIEAADTICKIQAENAKLRELIADVHEALKADRAGMFHSLTLASMEEDMRKLGIEVQP